MPQDVVSDGQYGFRKGRETSQACCLLNGITRCMNAKKSPVFTCTLDAEKCFDKI